MGKKNKKRRSGKMPATRKREAAMYGDKLTTWQRRLSDSDAAFGPEVAKMDEREQVYNGTRKLTPLVAGDSSNQNTSHVRNIVFENVESQIDSTIRYPKVTPMRKKDEHLAHIIERFIRNELERMPFESINDMVERTCNIQGGVLYWSEWDNSRRTHSTIGELVISAVHPKQLAPQPGVYTDIDDMDWFILKRPTTKQAILREYGIDVMMESEAEPGVRSADGESTSDEALTQYIGYERAENGKINKYSWVNDIELEDLENYQARRQPVCTSCGRVRPLPGQIIYSTVAAPAQTGEYQSAPQASAGSDLALLQQLAGIEAAGENENGGVLGSMNVVQEVPQVQSKEYGGGPCPWCGCEEFSDEEMEFEQVFTPMQTKGGVVIPGGHMEAGEDGVPVMKPTLIPFYQPDVYPVVLQRSVSVFGQLLGNSDVDAIRDQQNTVNRIEQKIIERLMKAGSRVTLPNDVRYSTDPKEGEVWRVKDPKDKNMIDVYTFSGDLSYEITYLNQVYEEARQILGITNSLQGRPDATATSGRAKEFSAAQSAGRLESKRVMKNAAYAKLFERMFKNWLAYSDEPRPITYRNMNGELEYEEFNRYDFLEQDADGQYWWNDLFLFGVDSTAPLANNREALWQETRMNLQTGAFGDPASTDTLILFWTKMEEQNYPGASMTKQYLEQKLQNERQLQVQQMQMMQAQQMAQAQGAPGTMPGGITG